MKLDTPEKKILIEGHNARSKYKQLRLPNNLQIGQEIVAEINHYTRMKVLRNLLGISEVLEKKRSVKLEITREYLYWTTMARLGIKRITELEAFLRDLIEMIPDEKLHRKSISAFLKDLKSNTLLNTIIVGVNPSYTPVAVSEICNGLLNWVYHEKVSFKNFLNLMNEKLSPYDINLDLAINDPDLFDEGIRVAGLNNTNDFEILHEFIKSPIYQEIKLVYIAEIEMYMSKLDQTARLYLLLNHRRLELLSLFKGFENRILTASHNSLNFPSSAYASRVFLAKSTYCPSAER